MLIFIDCDEWCTFPTTLPHSQIFQFSRKFTSKELRSWWTSRSPSNAMLKLKILWLDIPKSCYIKLLPKLWLGQLKSLHPQNRSNNSKFTTKAVTSSSDAVNFTLHPLATLRNANFPKLRQRKVYPRINTRYRTYCALRFVTIRSQTPSDNRFQHLQRKFNPFVIV